MKAVSRKSFHWAVVWTLGLTGCNALGTDPLSPPHLRQAACAAQNVGKTLEEKMSPEYQEWLSDVKHFWRDTQEEFAYEYHVNNNWPWPYAPLAMHSARQPLDIQTENARQQLTTLWDYHFESGTGKLNSMGRKRLSDLVGQSPALGQTVFVQRVPSLAETDLRIDEVRKEIDIMDVEEVTFEVAVARVTPTVVSGTEAQNAVKLLTEPKKKDATGKESGSGSGASYGSGSTGSGSQ